MTKDDPNQPALTPRARREANERRLRQARALRANLRRRKLKDRIRGAAGGDGDGASEALENKDESINRGGA
jgi:hypothetical protein